MKTFFSKFLAFFFAFIILVSSSIYFFKIDSFAVEMIGMDEAFIETWLFPIFSINNEWTFSQAGIRLRDSIEQHAATDNLSYSSDYNNAYAKTFGINNLVDPFDLSDADEFFTCYFANDVNYKKYVVEHKVEDIQNYLTSQEAADLKNYLLSPDAVEDLGYETVDAAWLNTVINTINLGGQTILVAFDKAGNWLGSTFDNILSAVKPLDADTTTSLTENLTEEFAYNPSTHIFFNNSISTVYPASEGGGVYHIAFNSPIFYFSDSHSATPSQYTMYIIRPVNADINVTNAHINFANGNSWTFANSFTANSQNSSYYPDIVINGVTFRTFSYNVRFYYNSTSTSYRYWVSANKFGSYDSIKQYLISNYTTWEDVDSAIPPYTVDLVDTQGVPYVVPDIDGLASVIGDIYPVIEALKEAIITIPADLTDLDSLIDTIPAELANIITDAINDAIANAISIPDILTDEATDNPDNPEEPDNPDEPFPDVPPNIPNWIWPSMFPALFDIKGLDIFKPIFDIVGTNYSMYDTWVLIPTILIFVLIIYIIVSLL